MSTPVRWAGSILLVVCVLAVGGALALTKYREIQAAMATPPPPEMPIAVSIRSVTEMAYRQQTSMIGTVIAPQSIMLSNEVAGTVTQVGFQSGDLVTQGQVLIQLDTSVEQAEVAAAAARVRLARSTLARMRQAAVSDAVTAAEVEQAEAQFDEAAATVAQLQAVIEKKTLRAPFPGKIGLSNTHIGQFLPSGFQIATLQSSENFVHVDFMVPQTAADSVTVGDHIALADGAAQYTAHIMAMDARADRQSRNLMARAKLSPVPPSLVPGDSVRVILEYGPELQTLAIPLESLRRAPMNTFVYVAEADQKGQLRARARTVRIAKTVGQQISVLEGLSPGEQVVADGSFKLREGALVVPASDAPNDAPAASGEAGEAGGDLGGQETPRGNAGASSAYDAAGNAPAS